MLERHMAIHINKWNKDFGFTITPGAFKNPSLHDKFLDSISNEFHFYGNYVGVDEGILVRDLKRNVEYSVWNQVVFEAQWVFAGVFFSVCHIGNINEFNFSGRTFTLHENHIDVICADGTTYTIFPNKDMTRTEIS